MSGTSQHLPREIADAYNAAAGLFHRYHGPANALRAVYGGAAADALLSLGDHLIGDARALADDDDFGGFVGETLALGVLMGRELEYPAGADHLPLTKRGDLEAER